MTSLYKEIHMSTRQHGDIYKIPNPEGNLITCTIYQTTNTKHIQSYGYLDWTYQHFIKILHRTDEGTNNIISSKTSMTRLALDGKYIKHYELLKFNPSQTSPGFYVSIKQGFRKHWGKEEIAQNKQFLLFQ